MMNVKKCLSAFTILIVGTLTLVGNGGHALASAQSHFTDTDISADNQKTVAPAVQTQEYPGGFLDDHELREQENKAVKQIITIFGINNIHALTRDHFRDGVQLVNLGFDHFGPEHLSAIKKLKAGYGHLGATGYRAPMKYDDIKPIHVEAMMLLNQGRASTSLTAIQEPTHDQIQAISHLLSMNSLKNSFGDHEIKILSYIVNRFKVNVSAVHAYHIKAVSELVNTITTNYYGSAPKNNLSKDEISAVASCMHAMDQYGFLTDQEKQFYVKELVWAIRLYKEIPNALARIIQIPAKELAHFYYVFDILWKRQGIGDFPNIHNHHLFFVERNDLPQWIRYRHLGAPVIFMGLQAKDDRSFVLFDRVAQHLRP